jgi:hypothetical protein
MTNIGRGVAVILCLKGKISSPERTAERFVENRDAHIEEGAMRT